ncbi:hypothetical protein D1605_002580 [Xylella fastidiosa subsp. fastidiosa]|jgi:hypothetical protein|uniref:Uncharacterized protein n=3 Tax=Xylella fastidiosa TaxID=2371 RepID=Q87E30_XYLFT|nr:hypothetical protein [Xylella fastidiosa]ADN63488.1 hypothetical protein XFLM_07890 [Xylella fastidiosa subsp. fastidiosa GB514]AAO28372.1 conserved hypothetical protein [Xylella fastidiosa Temecula1]ACB91937.1 hypothetical protein XfasM23_0490 [Xylella fastidiosa M23]KGM21282.1 hypothetical protein JT24_02710 [Xylella fastidiosa]MBE0262004.1 hypothetical protein [Xylella fastidiosa subsp. fastidiosa]
MGIDKVRELTVREIESVDGGVYFLNLNYRSLGGLIRTPMLTFFGIGNTAIAVNFGRGSSFYIKPTLNIDTVNATSITQEINQGT